MATVGVFGTVDFYERLAEEGQAGGDLSLVRLGPIDGAGAAARADACALVVAPCDAADPASLARVRVALPGLGSPALVLVAHSTPAVLTALPEAGAAEAISDSLRPREIVAHLRALLRPPGGTGVSPVREGAGCLAVDLERYEATVEGRPLDLTRREFSLLTYLVDHAGRACRREDLAREVWAGEITAHSRSIDMHIAHLREKLAGSGVQVTTLPGVGYRLDAL